MAPEISILKNYILMEASRGFDYWEIMEGIGMLLNMQEYPEKNDIWVFRDGPIRLYYDDLYNIRDFLKQNYHEDSIRSKTAIVAETGIIFGVAESFAQIAKDLPYEIRIFSDIQSAENWITEEI
jgi:hypothetical protein